MKSEGVSEITGDNSRSIFGDEIKNTDHTVFSIFVCLMYV